METGRYYGRAASEAGRPGLRWEGIVGQYMEERVNGRQDCREAFRESIKEEGRQ